MSQGKHTGPDFGFPETVIAQALAVREALGLSDESAPPRDRQAQAAPPTTQSNKPPVGDEQAQIDALREEALRTIDVQSAQIEQLIAMLEELANDHEADVSEPVRALTGSLGALAVARAAASSITSLVGAQAFLINAATVIASTQLAATAFKSDAGFILSATMVEMMDSKVKAFEAYMAEHGFAAALQASNFSYDNTDVAHAYLLKHDPQYRTVTYDVTRSTERRREDEKPDVKAQNDLARKYKVDTGKIDGEIADLEERKRSGTILDREQEARLQQLRAEREQLIKEAIERERAQRQARVEDTSDCDKDGKDSDARRQRMDKRLQDALAEWEKQKNALIAALRERASPGHIAEIEKEYAARREQIEQGSRKAGDISEVAEGIKQLKNDVKSEAAEKEAEKSKAALVITSKTGATGGSVSMIPADLSAEDVLAPPVPNPPAAAATLDKLLNGGEPNPPVAVAASVPAGLAKALVQITEATPPAAAISAATDVAESDAPNAPHKSGEPTRGTGITS